MSSVSWSGFLPPKPNTRYRVIVRDDGVNVSFTVSLHENPKVSKTVTCRSLFQSKTNYIALGGMVEGAAIIDRVEIKQEKSGTLLTSYEEVCTLAHSDPSKSQSEQRLLDGFAPKNSKLIFQDTFSDSSLDTSQWKKIGDSAVSDGVLHLGLPNDEGLIDTWKARPYLLTKTALDPDEGAITITGRMSFADNFLSGYGATFAVMTRANDQLGNVGHGWENSILQQGLRTTFWPASADTDHSLEIHKKPEPNTVTLVATQRLEIDPFVRDYLFKVIDDGKSISLTIIDPANPEKAMTISSPNTGTLKRGFIGFEGCWGSPVKLDDVRIYQSMGSNSNKR